MPIPDKYNIAILMATYNGENWVKEQIDSILNQNIECNINIFISDDCSDDNTLQIIQNNFSNECLIKYIKYSYGRLGSASANFLFLIKEINFHGYDAIFLSDQDDIWYDSKVKSSLNSLIVSGFDCYASDLYCLDKAGRRTLLRKSYPLKEYDYLAQGASAGCTYALSVEAVEAIKHAINPYPPIFFKETSHDWLIYAITRSNGFKWYIDPIPQLDYRLHSANAWGGLGFKSVLKRLRFIKSGWYRENILFIFKFIKVDDKSHKIYSKLCKYTLLDRLFLSVIAFKLRRNVKEAFLLSLCFLLGVF
jgi:rhamnosyltransferase